MTYHALVSPRGHVELNASFFLGQDCVGKLRHGEWYTTTELLELSGGRFRTLPSHAAAVEKNVKKWRYERQG